MTAQLPTFDELLKETFESFEKLYSAKPVIGSAAPGRVNLIGEHIDYCDGFVLPMVSSSNWFFLFITFRTIYSIVELLQRTLKLKIIDLSGSPNGHNDSRSKEWHAE